MQEYEQQLAEEKKMKPHLYTYVKCCSLGLNGFRYPILGTSNTIFDEDDLVPESYLVLCTREKDGQPNRLYRWRGECFSEGNVNCVKTNTV